MAKRGSNSIWQFIWSKWTIYLTVFLAPLYVSTSHWLPFTTPKTLLIMGGTLIALTFFVWGLLEHREESIKITYLHHILFAFLVILALAGFFGIDPHTSFFGTFFSSVGIVLLIMLGLLAFLVSEFTRRDNKFLRRLLLSGFLSGVVVAIIAYFPLLGAQWEFLNLTDPGGSTIGNSSFAGAFLLYAIGFGVYLAITSVGWQRRLFLLLGVLAILFCPTFFNADIWSGKISFSAALHSPFLFSGNAQGAQLGLAAAVLFAVSFWLVISEKKILKFTGAALLVCTVLVLSLGYIKLLNPESSIHRAFVEKKNATRFLFWDISQRALAEKPLLGWGFENYQTVYQQHFDPIVFKPPYTDEEGVTNPHNIIYDMAVSAGLFGVLFYLLLLGATCFAFFYFSLYASGRKREEQAAVIFSGIILGYFVQNLFVFDTPTAFLIYFLAIGLAMGCFSTMSTGRGIREITIPIESRAARNGIAYTLTLVLAVLFLILVILPLRESWQWQSLRSTALLERRAPAEVARMSFMGGLNDDARYANDVLNAVDDSRAAAGDDEKTGMLRVIKSTVLMLTKDNRAQPGNFYVNYEAGMLEHLAYVVDPNHDPALLDAAQEFLAEAHKISPLNPRVYYNLAQNELFRKNTKKAIAYIHAGMTLGREADGQAFLDRIKK